MKRKSVSYLKDLRKDVDDTRIAMQEISSSLELECFQLTKVSIDVIRTDDGSIHKDYMKVIKGLRLDLCKAIKAHEQAVKLHREFF